MNELLQIDRLKEFDQKTSETQQIGETKKVEELDGTWKIVQQKSKTKTVKALQVVEEQKHCSKSSICIGDQMKPNDDENDSKGKMSTKIEPMKQIQQKLQNYRDVLWVLRSCKTHNK